MKKTAKENVSIEQYLTHDPRGKIDKKTSESISKLFSLALAETTAPFRLIENNFFQSALKLLNVNYTPPSHQTVSRHVQNYIHSTKEKIKNMFENDTKISLCADFWTGKDSAGYLGVVALLLDKSNNTRHDFLIACKVVQHPHTASVVNESLCEVLIDYGIDELSDKRIISATTDNGSNMVAGLRETYTFSERDSETVREIESISDFESDDDEDVFEDLV